MTSPLRALQKNFCCNQRISVCPVPILITMWRRTMRNLASLFSSGDFKPQGFCYLWNPGLVWLHVVSDALIALAYFSIPITLIYFIRKKRDLPFNWMFL